MLKNSGKLDSLESEITKLYSEGFSGRQIANKFEISDSTVSRMLKKWNVTTRTSSEWKRLNGSLSWYKIADRRYFQFINTEQKAYWLGFIAADGYVSKSFLKIKLANKDKDHLEIFIRDIKFDGVVKLAPKENAVYVQINDEQLAQDISSHIITANKTFDCVAPETVPPKFLKHFWRGMFDGDGWSSVFPDKNIYTWGCVGNLSMMTSFKEYLREHTELRDTRIYNKNGTNAWHLAWGGKYNLAKIRDVLDGRNGLRLDRKFGKIDHIYPPYKTSMWKAERVK